jgi:hypothetical protein
MPPEPTPHGLSDTVLAGSLLAAPAWTIWLTEINDVLTTLSLAVGLCLALSRLWFFLRDRYRR